VVGVDVSESAVLHARLDERFDGFRSAEFHCVPEDTPQALPREQFDIVISSHVLEHVPDDALLLRAMYERLVPGGIAAIFVPIEEPDYILFHRRNYSLQSIAERIAHAGFQPLLVEGSLYVNGHVWKLLTIPSRRQWPLMRHVADGFRVGTLGVLSYRAVRQLDQLLFRMGAGARQALIIARRPPG
jgi:SAM-dependent methyltransferase